MARSTLADLRNVLRGLTQAGTADYTLGTSVYWDDGQLDTVLDANREDYVFEPMTPYPVIGVGGTSLYYEYRTDQKYFESTSGGTSIFYVQNGAGSTIGTANWSADYLRGIVTFTADQAGTSYFYTGRVYDMNAAAAEVWRSKAGYYHNAFSFSTDNHRIDREAVYKHCLEMAERFEAMSQDSIVTIDVWRNDTDVI